MLQSCRLRLAARLANGTGDRWSAAWVWLFVADPAAACLPGAWWSVLRPFPADPPLTEHLPPLTERLPGQSNALEQPAGAESARWGKSRLLTLPERGRLSG
ncbi:MAG: hypothetical protein CBB71_08400 [Rhodopirellula sp. TMED11]|nr:MAG: hypothetical protein CBB71_08400 [Rhodopirellula sp. TMED11]